MPEELLILRWGNSTPQKSPKPVTVLPFSAPPMPDVEAVPLDNLLQQQAQAMAQFAPPDAIVTKDVEPEPVFVMSKSGIVHEPSCGVTSRIKDAIPFYSTEEVFAHKKYKKFHTCCDKKGLV